MTYREVIELYLSYKGLEDISSRSRLSAALDDLGRGQFEKENALLRMCAREQTLEKLANAAKLNGEQVQFACNQLKSDFVHFGIANEVAENIRNAFYEAICTYCGFPIIKMPVSLNSSEISYGRKEFSNGEVYMGDLVDGRPHGKGTLFTPNHTGDKAPDHLETIDLQDIPDTHPGIYYRGEFVDGYPEGNGERVNTRIDETLKGQFKKGLLHGKGIRTIGTFYYADGYFYNGDLQGEGLVRKVVRNRDIVGHVEIMTDIYKGHFEKGELHGSGSHVFTHEDTQGIIKYTWDGLWTHGVYHGDTVIDYPNGDHYEGQMENRELGPRGTYTFANGSVYTGEFEHNVMQGHGVFVYANGDRYEGNWKNNRFHGKGTFVHMDTGKVRSGYWNEGKEVFFPPKD